MTDAAERAAAPTPRLSVVVPIYDVERYLPACLDSLATQSLREIEVIMVDDGSPDGSAALAADFAGRDARFRLVRQTNGGLGNARNTGVRHISPYSEFLTFVDSDDIVPPHAYSTMVETLEETGSDFATGNVHHLDAERTWQTPMLRMLAARTRKATHISRFRELAHDRIACNKVFRRSFWDEHGFVFPEGILHEDIPVALPAHYLAHAVDVIRDPVYLWRVRDAEAAPSITQRRTEPAAVRGRVEAVETVSRFLASQAAGQVAGQGGETFASYKRDYDARVLRSDLRIFLRVLPEGDEEYRRAFIKSANRFLDQADQRALLDLPVRLRAQWLLVRRRALPELLASLAAERRNDPVRVRGLLRKHAQLPELDGGGPRPALPHGALELRNDLELRSPVRNVEWREGVLHLSGDAWITRVDASSPLSMGKVVQLRRSGSRRRTVLPVRNRYRPERTAESGGPGYNYDWAGYELDLDPRRLQRNGQWVEGTWHLGIGVVTPGLFRRGAITVPGNGAAAAYPPYQWMSEDVRVLPAVTEGRLTLRVERVRAQITGVGLNGTSLEVRGALRTAGAGGAATVSARDTAVLRLTAMHSERVAEYPVHWDRAQAQTETGTQAQNQARPRDGLLGFTVHVPLGDIALEHWDTTERSARPDRHGWSSALYVRKGDGTEQRFGPVLQEGLHDAEFALPAYVAGLGFHGEVAVTGGQNGYLKLWGRTHRAVLEDARWEADGRLTVSGRTTARPRDPRMVLRSASRKEEKAVPLRVWEEGRFEATFDPAAFSGPGGVLPLKTGRWHFLLRDTPGAPGVQEGEPEDIPFKADRTAVPHLTGLTGHSHGRGYELGVRWGDFPHLHAESELDITERGPYRQRRMVTEVYEAERRNPLRDAVLYISYNGKQFSDSPRTVYEELTHRGADLEHLWAVRDGQATLPLGAHRVPLWSEEWFRALARSRYVVTNGHLPEWVRRREGQVIVQTWHGTMLKKIGHDIEDTVFDPAYQEKLRIETENWNLLVSANRFSTPILRRAFGYDGEILESGYPRNDCLYAEDRDRCASEVRWRLGLPEDKKVVLYAPTWRDDRRRGGGFRLDVHLDLADAAARLGEDHVLLVRRHSHVVDSFPEAGDGFVRDVSEYPDIADLYLVADILITDYSSVMFDFAHTRRPMLFFTYDLEHYRDTLRGFYFDFEKEAPGPLLHTSAEVVDAVRDIDAVAAAHAGAYERFHDRFCDLDDGHAAARVADRMLELGEEAPRDGAPRSAVSFNPAR